MKSLPGIERTDLFSFALGGLVAAGFAVPPMLHGGPIWLLDWAVGPQSQNAWDTFELTGGVTTGLPLDLAISKLYSVIGSVATWIPLLLFFPMASVSIGRLVRGGASRRIAAGALYIVNPFVFERIYAGHVSLLLGYALLPLAIASILNRRDQRGITCAVPAFWWALLTGLSPHFFWIFAVCLFCAAFSPTNLLVQRLRWLAINCIVFLCAVLYLAIPAVAYRLPVSVGSMAELAAFRTAPDVHLGLIPNLLGLYGFWRIGPRLPKDVVAGWPIILSAILVIVALGVVRLRRTGRNTGLPNAGSGFWLGLAALGLVVALGDQGLTGGIFRLCYEHVPGFYVLREPEKFLSLLALTYSVFFGLGIEALVDLSRQPTVRRQVAAMGVAVGLPLIYSPTLFDGLAGQLATTRVSPSWSAVDRLVSSGSGSILVLPWHLYLSLAATGGRTVANPAPYLLSRPVISGDNLQISGLETTSRSPRSAYLTRLLAESGHSGNFGAKVRPLGVQYVVLIRNSDWSSYSWLFSQVDLEPILRSDDLDAWRNLDYAGVGARTSSLASANTPHREPVGNIRISRTAAWRYSVGAGAPGWVWTDAEYRPGWSLGANRGRQSSSGTVLVHVSRKGGVLVFTPIRDLALGYGLSVLAAGGFLCQLIRVRRLQRGAPYAGGPLQGAGSREQVDQLAR